MIHSEIKSSVYAQEKVYLLQEKNESSLTSGIVEIINAICAFITRIFEAICALFTGKPPAPGLPNYVRIVEDTASQDSVSQTKPVKTRQEIETILHNANKVHFSKLHGSELKLSLEDSFKKILINDFKLTKKASETNLQKRFNDGFALTLIDDPFLKEKKRTFHLPEKEKLRAQFGLDFMKKNLASFINTAIKDEDMRIDSLNAILAIYGSNQFFNDPSHGAIIDLLKESNPHFELVPFDEEERLFAIPDNRLTVENERVVDSTRNKLVYTGNLIVTGKSRYHIVYHEGNQLVYSPKAIEVTKTLMLGKGSEGGVEILSSKCSVSPSNSIVTPGSHFNIDKDGKIKVRGQYNMAVSE